MTVLNNINTYFDPKLRVEHGQYIAKIIIIMKFNEYFGDSTRRSYH